MASFIEIVEKLNRENPDAVNMQIVNRCVLEADRGTKKRSPHLKIAVPEETASNYLSFGKPKEIGFLIHINHDEWIRANDELKKDKNK